MLNRTTFLLGACILLGLHATARGTDPFIQYVAGIEVLRAAPHISEEQKARYAAKLSELTGVTAARARERIACYYNNPEQWKKIQENIISLLDKQPEPDKE
jgi:hypothetical protein